MRSQRALRREAPQNEKPPCVSDPYQVQKPGQKHFRVGISVGKRIGNAVHRNWVKRRIRQTLLEVKPYLRQDVDFLVIARPAADGLEMAETKKNLVHALKRAHLLEEKSEDR